MLFTIVALILSLHPGLEQHSEKPLDRMSFMVGRWVGAGTGAPGDSQGEFSFAWGLSHNVLIRRSFAEYPATNGRPASRHDDLMIVFSEGGKLRADYFDNEGHTIRYSVMIAADGNSIEFLSEAIEAAPRYRLTYSKTGDADSLKLKFEIAPADRRDVFTSYIDATLQRVR